LFSLFKPSHMTVREKVELAEQVISYLTMPPWTHLYVAPGYLLP